MAEAEETPDAGVRHLKQQDAGSWVCGRVPRSSEDTRKHSVQPFG